MKNFYVEKDGWHVKVNDGKCGWVESYPTYTTLCANCRGSGYYYINSSDCHVCQESKDDGYGIGCGYGCDHKRNCSCNNGFTRDRPKHPMPSIDILDVLAIELAKTMKDFGLRLDSGIIEKEITEKKAKNASLQGASL